MRSLALADSVHTCHVLSSWRWLGVDLGQDSGRQLALTPGLVKMVGCAVAPHRGTYIRKEFGIEAVQIVVIW